MIDASYGQFLSCTNQVYSEKKSALNDPWIGSPFAWLKQLPSRTLGKVGEDIMSAYLAEKGFDIKPSPDSEADRVINERRTEIKLRTRWAGGFFKFQQIRDQNYDLAICVGISPNDVHAWMIPKPELSASGAATSLPLYPGMAEAQASIQPG